MSTELDRKDILPSSFEDVEDVSGYDDEDVKGADITDSDEYYALPKGGNKNIIFSVISLVSGVLALLLCPFSYPSFVLAPLAAATSIVYRIQFGFFNKPAVIGLVLSIFGGIFSVVALIIAKLHLFA